MKLVISTFMYMSICMLHFSSLTCCPVSWGIDTQVAFNDMPRTERKKSIFKLICNLQHRVVVRSSRPSHHVALKCDMTLIFLDNFWHENRNGCQNFSHINICRLATPYPYEKYYYIFLNSKFVHIWFKLYRNIPLLPFKRNIPYSILPIKNANLARKPFPKWFCL